MQVHIACGHRKSDAASRIVMRPAAVGGRVPAGERVARPRQRARVRQHRDCSTGSVWTASIGRRRAGRGAIGVICHRVGHRTDHLEAEHAGGLTEGPSVRATWSDADQLPRSGNRGVCSKCVSTTVLHGGQVVVAGACIDEGPRIAVEEGCTTEVDFEGAVQVSRAATGDLVADVVGFGVECQAPERRAASRSEGEGAAGEDGRIAGIGVGTGQLPGASAGLDHAGDIRAGAWVTKRSGESSGSGSCDARHRVGQGKRGRSVAVAESDTAAADSARSQTNRPIGRASRVPRVVEGGAALADGEEPVRPEGIGGIAIVQYAAVDHHGSRAWIPRGAAHAEAASRSRVCPSKCSCEAGVDGRDTRIGTCWSLQYVDAATGKGHIRRQRSAGKVLNGRGNCQRTVPNAAGRTHGQNNFTAVARRLESGLPCRGGPNPNLDPASWNDGKNPVHAKGVRVSHVDALVVASGLNSYRVGAK